MTVKTKIGFPSPATLVAGIALITGLSLGALRIHAVRTFDGVWSSNIDDAECELVLSTQNTEVRGILKCRDSEQEFQPVAVKGFLNANQVVLDGDGVKLQGEKSSYKIRGAGLLPGLGLHEDITFARGPFGSRYSSDNPFVTDRIGTTVSHRNLELGFWITFCAVSLIAFVVSITWPRPRWLFIGPWMALRRALQPAARRDSVLSMEAPTPIASEPEVFTCTHCRGLDTAPKMPDFERLVTVFESSHWEFVVMKCPKCRTFFLNEWKEIIDWTGRWGSDHIWEHFTPLIPAERDELLRVHDLNDTAVLLKLCEELIHVRPRLTKHPDGSVYWSDYPYSAADSLPPG